MNRNLRTLIVLVVAVVVAAAASFAAYQAALRMPRQNPEVSTVDTVVAARPLAMGTLLTKDDIKVVKWPTSAAIPGAFQTGEGVVDRGLLTAMSENEPITAPKLAPEGTGAGLPPTIPAGMRAVSVKVNEVVGVAGFVVPGTKVDVMVSVRQRQNLNDSVARVVVSNVQVLAAGTRYDQVKAQQDGQPIPTTVVTLLVTPDDAERIALATQEGTIMLALRNPLDTDPAKTSGAKLANLLGPPAPPPVERVDQGRRVVRAVQAPKPPEPKPYVVETIRAAKRSEEEIR